MSRLNSEEIKHLADLARVSIGKEEIDTFSRQLPEIVDFVAKLQEITQEVDLNPRTVELDQLRNDTEHDRYLSIKEIEQLAPKWSKDQVIVPPVLISDEPTDV